ncbi:hypothetical protein A0256_08550 [Mucilaginibacter sp. PAMC 26640]|nr:hypothetical protein A0256_08550 [Mucilaginibacter sp. PAMC 26640]
MEKKLYRNEHNKMIGGVCSGLGDYLNIDPTIVRLVFLVMLFAGHGAGFVLYIILLIVLPKRGLNFNDPGFKPGVDYKVPPASSFSSSFNSSFNKPFDFPPIPAKKSSNAGMIFGVVLIALGTLFLIDELDFIPDLDFDKLWPAILVAAGAALIFTGQKKQPWENPNWSATSVHAAEEQENTSTADKSAGIDLTKKTNETSTDNPTTI